MAAPTPSHILNWGLITLYLKSYPAARNATTDLVNLHQPCITAGDARLAMLKRCKICLKEAPEAEIVKGYASAKGSYVLFSPEEIEALAATNSKGMTLRGFVKYSDIDPIWLGAANFLGPVDAAAMRPFQLFVTAMRDANMAALVTYFGHGRDKVGVIRVGEETLILHDAFFPSEVRTYSQQAKVQLVAAEFSPDEKRLASALIQQAEIEFAPAIAEMRDGYLDRVTELRIAREAGLAMPTFDIPAAPQPQTLDLVAALKASLSASESQTATKKPPQKMIGTEARAEVKDNGKKKRSA